MMRSMRAAIMLMGAPLLAGAPAQAQIASAQVTGGAVSGEVGGDLSIFRGIPFAAPPVGPLRWKAPQPVAPWQGTRRADQFGPACMQEARLAGQMGQTGPISEDCLYLNVWTPARAAREKRPVIVWIYGGGFNAGMTSIPLYDGANFARKGVVFVSIAYRVGPFGFLAHPALSAESGKGSGNYGMLDQIAGLQWVKANIAQFGGDPDRVTLLGHSAGAYAVSILSASPLARGLFHGVIAQSGANFPPAQQGTAVGGSNLQTLADAEKKGVTLFGKLGAANPAAARALPAAQVEAAADAPGAPRFWPSIDGHVLPGDQVRLWQAGRFNDTPLLVGSNSDEAANMGARQVEPATFTAETRRDYGAGAEALLGAYSHATPDEAARASKQLRRDTSFGWPAYRWAGLQSARGKGKAWVYYFDRPTAQNPDGSPHGAEVALVFSNPDQRPGRLPWGEAERAISDRMQHYWVNFATTGDPNGAGLPAWPAFDMATQRVMLLGAKTEPVPIPNADKLRALDSYYDWLGAQAAK